MTLTASDASSGSPAPPRVLVTGAAGFIGRHALPLLQAGGYEVHAVDVTAPADPVPAIHWHRGDLLDALQTDRLLAEVRPSHLLHFAWYAKPGEYWNSLENIRWVEASLHLLTAFHLQGGQRVVMAGTCAEYDWSQGDCSEEATPLSPTSLYGACKNALQTLLGEFSRVTGLSSAWGRIFFLYGPGEPPQRLVSSVILHLLRKEPAPCSHGRQVRDFLHVEDVASAFVSLLASSVRGPVNIASGQPVTLREVVLAAADCLGARDLVQFGAVQVPRQEPPRIVGHCRRLADEVGWQPRYDLAAGMVRTVRYWQDRNGS
jgi:nucleoside-diphosphate-sugar epimerase